jgi:hypothetical protein
MMNDQEQEWVDDERPSAAKVGDIVNSNGREGDTKGQRRPAAGRRTDITRGALSRPVHPDDEPGPTHSGIKRTVGIIRAAVPLAQKMLPLLDGNVALAVANLLTPRLQGPDLHPMEASVAHLSQEVASLGQAASKNEARLKRIEDEVESVKNSLEQGLTGQKQLQEDLKRARTSMTVLALLGILLLAASVAANIFLLVRAQRALP